MLEALPGFGVQRTDLSGEPVGRRITRPALLSPPRAICRHGVDLAVIAVPRESILAAIDDCAAAGVKGIVVISAGFAETDARGRELQTELVERVRGYGMRMVGPNCMGVSTPIRRSG